MMRQNALEHNRSFVEDIAMYGYSISPEFGLNPKTDRVEILCWVLSGPSGMIAKFSTPEEALAELNRLVLLDRCPRHGAVSAEPPLG